MVIFPQAAGVGIAGRDRETHTESPPTPGPWKCSSGSRWGGREPGHAHSRRSCCQQILGAQGTRGTQAWEGLCIRKLKGLFISLQPSLMSWLTSQQPSHPLSFLKLFEALTTPHNTNPPDAWVTPEAGQDQGGAFRASGARRRSIPGRLSSFELRGGPSHQSTQIQVPKNLSPGPESQIKI